MRKKPGSQVSDNRCGCGSGRSFDGCCGAFIEGDCPPPTAEALMRSRYCAYVQGSESYLLNTWHPDTRPTSLDLNPEQRWFGLKVLTTTDGTEQDQEGTVEFVARFKVGGRGHRLHEISQFVRTRSGWQYLDGVQVTR